MSELYEWSYDNKKYTHDDTAPIGCDDCASCSSCCQKMGDTILQDPYDLWNFCSNMKVSGGMAVTFDILVSEDGPWELSYQDGVILPNIKMVEDGRCPFLNEKGRCLIHPIRSGLCRLFPLGRGFENGKVIYYVLNDELGCEKKDNPRSPVIIKDWLGIKDIERYEDFQSKWYKIRDDLRNRHDSLNEETFKTLQMRLLELFYQKPYDKDFFADFGLRAKEWEDIIRQYE